MKYGRFQAILTNYKDNTKNAMPNTLSKRNDDTSGMFMEHNISAEC